MKRNGFLDFLMKRRRSKTWLVMRFIILFLFVSALHVSARVYSQETKVTLQVANASLETVIRLLEKRSDYRFLYEDRHIENIVNLNLNYKDVGIRVILDDCLKGTDVGYKVMNNTIVLQRISTIASDTVKKITISGLVKDEKGEPLPGVTIHLKKTSIGFVSNAEGKFRFELPKQDSLILIFSFVGFKPQEILVKNNKPLVIIMKEEITSIEEVVVTGYQAIQRRDMVGAYTTVKAEDIMKPAYSSIDQMLQGQIAGLMVMNTSSRVGAKPKIQIRGVSTILGNQDPLWVVDGIIQPDPIPLNNSSLLTDDLKNILGNQVSWLNPSDIETVTVLKDASATAIYGSKASNGVIVVTTKRGTADRLSVNYSVNFSFRARPTYDMFNLMNSKERIDYAKEAFAKGGRYIMEPLPQVNTYEGLTRLFYEKKVTPEEYADHMRKLETTNTDWLDILTQDSFSHNHNLSFMGGTKQFTYNASLGFSDEKGVEIGDASKRMTARLRIGADLLPTLKLDLSLVGTMGKNTGFGPGIDPLGYATSTSRAIRAFDENGDMVFYNKYVNYELNDNITNGLGYNIVNEINNSYSWAKNSSIQGDLNLNWDVLPWLSYQLVMGISENNVNSRAFAGEHTFHVASRYRGYDWGTAEPGSALFKSAALPFGGELFTSDTKTIAYNIQNKVLIQKTFKEDHRINMMVAAEVRSTDNTMVTNTVWGYSPERGDKIVAPTSLDDLVPIFDKNFRDWQVLKPLYQSGGAWTRRAQTENYFSLFATLAYSYANRYVLNANIRNDASNRFGQNQNKRFDPNYSFGVSWRMAEESFIKDNINWLNQLNFRATYGIQGNSVNSVSPDMIVGQVGVVFPFNEYGVGISSLPNPKLSWERTKTWNLGFDLELFNGISMNLEYYRRSSDAIASQEIPNEYGMNSMRVNGGRVTNNGVEYTLNITPIKRKDIAWTIGLNSSKNWNKAKEVKDGKQPMDLHYLDGSSGRVLKSGYPLSAFWAYSYAGLNHDTGIPEFNLLDQEVDQTMDPVNYLVYAGQKEPSFTGGINTRFRYKGLSFGADFAVLLGASKRLKNIFPNGECIPEAEYNLDKELTKRWQKPGDEAFTDVPAIYNSSLGSSTIQVPDGMYRGFYSMWSQSDLRVVSADFLRCTQMSLTWNIDPEWTKKVGLRDVSVQVAANNVFVITSKKFNGFDPELDNSVMPRTYTMGINIGF